MKRLVLAFFTVAFVISFCACGNGEGSDNSAEISTPVADSEISDVSEEASSEEGKTVYKPVINGSAIDEYTIVYVKTTDEATYEAVALELQSYIKDNFGAELALQDETSEETDKEIIIGHSNKRSICAEHDSAFGYGGYKVVISGTKLLIEADYATGCYQGYKALIEKIEGSEDGVFSDSSFEGEGSVVKVACVGDSITHGINSTYPDTQNYPHYLQEMLGLDYYVMNAGITDRSICSTDVYNYGSSIQHMLALDLAPDVVIFNLGTNDANPAHDYKSWTDPATDRETLFVNSANALLDEYVTVNADVQIFLCLPSSLFSVENDKWNAEAWTANIVEYVHPLLTQIAADRGLQTVDFFGWSLENPEVFADGLHPKDEGYKVYAEYLYDCIKESIKQP